MREISTEKIKIGEHVMIDGVEYVAKSDNGYHCKGCDFYNSSYCAVPCGECVIVKVEKQLVDKDTQMTNLQLAEWLAKGNGQFKFRNGNTVFSFIDVYEDEEDLAVDGILIRPWGTDEWVKPTLEIYERDCRCPLKDSDR